MSDAKSPLEARVQARAYALWEQDGRPEGKSEQHWHQARSEIEREDAQPPRSGMAAAPTTRAKKGKSKIPYPGMMGDGTEEQNLDQTGDPSARITQADVQAAFDPAGKI
jgi:hypothetical protein